MGLPLGLSSQHRDLEGRLHRRRWDSWCRRFRRKCLFPDDGRTFAAWFHFFPAWERAAAGGGVSAYEARVFPSTGIPCAGQDGSPQKHQSGARHAKGWDGEVGLPMVTEASCSSRPFGRGWQGGGVERLRLAAPCEAVFLFLNISSGYFLTVASRSSVKGKSPPSSLPPLTPPIAPCMIVVCVLCPVPPPLGPEGAADFQNKSECAPSRSAGGTGAPCFQPHAALLQ